MSDIVSAGPTNFVDAMQIAQAGFDDWANKPHNAKLARKIDGTPIPNDVVVCIAERICSTLHPAPTRDDVLEEAAEVCDDRAQDFNRRRDPGMANHCRSLGRAIRSLKGGNPLSQGRQVMNDTVERLRELEGQTDAFAKNQHHSFVTTQQMARESAAACHEAAATIERLTHRLSLAEGARDIHAASLAGATERVDALAAELAKAQRDAHEWQVATNGTQAHAEALAKRVRLLRGTITYILEQAELGHANALAVIKANAKAALDGNLQGTVAAARAAIPATPEGGKL